jgi:hypothetical protein
VPSIELHHVPDAELLGATSWKIRKPADDGTR